MRNVHCGGGLEGLLLLGSMVLLLPGCELLGSTSPDFPEREVIAGTSHFAPLGPHGPEKAFPKVSPDGDRLLWNEFSEEHGADVIYLVSLETGHRRGLTEGRNADWSPDGQWIAFNRGVHIYKIRPDGSALTQLTTRGRNFFPDWSPDGSKIAYDRSLEDDFGPDGVWIMNADGSGKHHVFGGAAPDWHPSGDKIVAMRQIPPSTYVLAIHELGIGQSSNILHDIVNGHSDPRFSPDGEHITFANEEGIWVVREDGRQLRRLVPNHYPGNPDFLHTARTPRLMVSTPSWHPSGQQIVFEYFRIKRFEQYRRGPGPRLAGSFSIGRVEVDR